MVTHGAADRVILRGATLLGGGSDDPVDLVIHGGRIEAIASAGSTSDGRVVDVAGLTAMPGVVDAHTHPIHDETFESVGRVAARGGVTTVMHHLYPQPGEAYADAVNRATASAALGQADFGYHIRLTPDRLEEGLDGLGDLPGVVGAKLFLAHSDPSVMSEMSHLYTALRAARDARVRILVHAEMGAILNLHEEQVAPYLDLDRFQAARPASLEAAAVAVAAAVAELTGGPLYVAHVSNAATLEAARAAKERGVDIQVESCPHYFFLDSTLPLGGKGRVTPPLRRPEEVERMRERIRRGGYVDVLGSDHCGYGEHEKFDDVTSSSNGLPGIELMLPLFLDAAASGQGWITSERILQLLCEGPARAFGVARKGRLAPGYDADITLIDPAASWTVDGGDLADRSFYSPYHGRTLRQRIERVYRRGDLVHDVAGEAELTAGAPIARR